MRTHTSASAVMACDLFKVLSGLWLTVPDVAEELGISDDVASVWLKEYEAQGIVIGIDQKPKPGRRGRVLRQFTLSAKWGGMA